MLLEERRRLVCDTLRKSFCIRFTRSIYYYLQSTTMTIVGLQ